MPTANQIREQLLEVVAEVAPKGPGDGSLQSGTVLRIVHERLGKQRDHLTEEGILTAFHDLFRTGYLAWGFNLANPNPPFFHITDQGRRSLENYSRDPSNPDGYFAYLTRIGELNPIANSYLAEAVSCFASDLPKSAAVMIGASSESLALEIRDSIVNYLENEGEQVPQGLNDWRIKIVLDSIQVFFDGKLKEMPREIKDSYRSYWSAFTQQVRAIRNDAGHPNSVEPIEIEAVHASLLIFPELLRLSINLKIWVESLSE